MCQRLSEMEAGTRLVVQDAREDVDLTADSALAELASEAGVTRFTGYADLLGDASVLRLVRDGEVVESSGEGDTVDVVLDTTPFYAESGGQVGDVGTLTVRITAALCLACGVPAEYAAPVGVLCAAALNGEAIMTKHCQARSDGEAGMWQAPQDSRVSYSGVQSAPAWRYCVNSVIRTSTYAVICPYTTDPQPLAMCFTFVV